MLPEFRYFLKNFQIKIGFIAKLLFNTKLKYCYVEGKQFCLLIHFISKFYLYFIRFYYIINTVFETIMMILF